MSRNLKILSLAFAAVLSISAVAAASAQAVTEFHCTATSANCFVESSGGTFGEGPDDNVFTVGKATGEELKVKCVAKNSKDGAFLKGTAPKTTATAQLHPEYRNCSFFGQTATISTTGCDYLFHLAAGGPPFTSTADVVCGVGSAITITIPNCVVTVNGQTGLGTITLTNSETSEPTDVNASVNVTGITYSTNSGTGCPPLLKGQTMSDGIYTGTATLTGFEDNNGVKGAKVGLHVF